MLLDDKGGGGGVDRGGGGFEVDQAGEPGLRDAADGHREMRHGAVRGGGLLAYVVVDQATQSRQIVQAGEVGVVAGGEQDDQAERASDFRQGPDVFRFGDDTRDGADELAGVDVAGGHFR